MNRARPLNSAADCKSLAAAGTVRLLALDPQTIASSFFWANGPAGTLQLVGGRRIEPGCAAAVTDFSMSQMRLADGTVLKQMEVNGPFLPATERLAFSAEEDRTPPHPPIAGAEFVMASAAGFSRQPAGLTTHHVGLWRDSGRSRLYAFSRSASNRLIAPIPVLSSRLPLRSVRYFPAPDTASGRLDLVQEDGAGRARVVSLDWSHPGLFQ
jgi:hypothetical protein